MPVVKCVVCHSERQTANTSQGIARTPRGWKTLRGQPYCPSCKRSSYSLRALILPVAKPEGASWAEFRERLRPLWIETTRCANWMVSELYARDVRRGPEVVLRLIGSPAPAHRHLHSPEEIELLIAESRDGGLLEPDEHRRLQRALRLNLKQAKQLMVPRRKIAAIDIDTPLAEVVAIVAQSPFSRLPVYRGSIDNVIGMLHTKDLVRWRVTGEQPVVLSSLLRPIASVHESVAIDRVLRELRERRAHQALVVDEFGGTAGLLTLEDVLSELLGNVGDEFKAGEPLVETLGDGRVRIPGEMAVDDAAALLNTSWETDAATMSGLVTAVLGRLPTPGDRVIVGEYELEVERVAERAVQTLIAARVVPTPVEAEK
jgi:CBS domain containing-hemolysin-like protein